jgi:hypothetical protein
LAAHWAEVSQTVAALALQVPLASQNSPAPQSMSVRQLAPDPPDEQADSSAIDPRPIQNPEKLVILRPPADEGERLHDSRRKAQSHNVG